MAIAQLEVGRNFIAVSTHTFVTLVEVLIATYRQSSPAGEIKIHSALEAN